MAEGARKAGFNLFGFSSHAPVTFDNPWSIPNLEKVGDYTNAIRSEQQIDGLTCILAGLEADYCPGISHPFELFRNRFNLQFVIGSVHLVEYKGQIWFIDGPAQGYHDGLLQVFEGDFRLALTQYYRQINAMIMREKPDVLGHADKVLMHNAGRYIDPEDPFHLSLLKETLLLASHNDVLVEINTRGIYTGHYTDYYPGRYIFPFLKEHNIKVIMSADAHSVDQLSMGFAGLKQELYEAGISCVSEEEIADRFRQSQV